MQRNLFVVMRLGSPVVVSYLDAGFKQRCDGKDFLTACCCLLLLLLLLKRVAHPWPLKGGVKPRQGKPSSVIKSRLELGPSWVLVLRNALDITVEETPLALEMCLHRYGECPEKHGSTTAHFHLKMDHCVAPRRGTHLIEHPFAIL